jgi:hypothetical protein
VTRSLLFAALAASLVQPAVPATMYRDPAGRFTFSYPASYGSIGPGTADGSLDRVASFRFSSFPARFGGEPVVTRGFPLVDLQALGGLYDSLTLEIFPEPLRSRVVSQLPRLTLTNFCAALAAPRHLDPALPAFASLRPQERDAIGGTDLLRNDSPHVVECRSTATRSRSTRSAHFSPATRCSTSTARSDFSPGPTRHFNSSPEATRRPPALIKAIEDLVRSFRASG